MYRISVIIPNYNNSKYLKKCLYSILNQTEKSYEIFFIDDGSTDNSLEIVEKFRKNNKIKMTVIKQYNQNASIARNRGIELIDSEYCYFLDSDDYIYDNECFEKMLSCIGNSDLLIGNYIMIDENGKYIDKYDYKKELFNYENRYNYCGISPVPSNKLFKSSIIKDNNLYFSNVRIGQDLNFFLKYLYHCNNIEVIDDYLYCYRKVSNGMSNSNNLNFLDICNSFDLVNKYYRIKKSNDYNRYISPVAIKHYHNQLVKVRFFKNRKLKRFIFNYFSYIIYNEKMNSNCNKKVINKEIKIYYIKKILLLLKLYDLVKSYVLNKNSR